jgi:AraC-like DNA-binding protein
MKVLPFKIPKPENEVLVYQEDEEAIFYDKLHQHEEIQISWIVRGEGTLVIGDSVSDYQRDDLLVFGKNLPHVFKSDVIENGKSLMFSVFFSKDSFGKGFFGWKEFETLQSFFSKSEHGFRIISQKKSIQEKFLQLKKASKLERFIYLFEILQLISISKTELLSSFIYQKNYSDNEGKRMSEIFDFTMNSFAENITLKEVSAIANLTPNAFCKYFKQRTNKTYIQFLTELRIEHSAKLLRKNPDYSVAEIAILSGFQNISNFNRKFKLLKKKTPIQFRGN